MFPQLPVQPSTIFTRTDTLSYETFLIFDGTYHKNKHNSTATPPSTVIAAVDNHFLPPSDDNDNNDSNPADLMGKYDGSGEKKGK